MRKFTTKIKIKFRFDFDNGSVFSVGATLNSSMEKLSLGSDSLFISLGTNSTVVQSLPNEPKQAAYPHIGISYLRADCLRANQDPQVIPMSSEAITSAKTQFLNPEQIRKKFLLAIRATSSKNSKLSLRRLINSVK